MNQELVCEKQVKGKTVRKLIKKTKNDHRGVLLLVMQQRNFLKVTFLHGCFYIF